MKKITLFITFLILFSCTRVYSQTTNLRTVNLSASGTVTFKGVPYQWPTSIPAGPDLILQTDSTGHLSWITGAGGGTITGGGTTNKVPIWLSSSSLGSSNISAANLNGPGTGLLLNDKVLIGASTATTTDATTGALFVRGGVTLANNAVNAQTIQMQALSGESDIFSSVTGSATVKPLALGLNDAGGPIANIKMFPGSIINGTTGGNQMVWNPPFSGFENTIDVGLFSTPEAFKGTKFLVQVYTTDVDSVAAHTAIDGSVLYRLTDGSSGVAGGVLGHVAIDPQTGSNVTSATGVVGAAGIAYTLIQPGNAQVNLTNSIVGINGRVTHYAAGTLTTAYAANTNGPVISGSGIIDNAYGFAILDVGTNFATGHTNHAVGLWIEPIVAGTVDNFAIKSDGGDSYHVGNFKIGDNAAPTAALDVVGQIIVTSPSSSVAQIKSTTSTANISFTTNTTTTPVVTGNLQGVHSGTSKGITLISGNASTSGEGTSLFLIDNTASTGSHFIGMSPLPNAPPISSSGTYAFFIDSNDGNKLKVMGPSNTITLVAVP